MDFSGNVVGSDNRGPIVNILVWICFVLSSLSIISKIIVKVGRRTRNLQWSRLQLDDGAIILTLVFSLAFSVCISQQVGAGLGSHIKSLSPENVVVFQKLGFAADFMYISATFSGNVCGIFFAKLLEPASPHRKVIYLLSIFTFIWYLSSMIVLAVQCNLPNRWQSINNQCIDLQAFWASFDVINTFINVSLSVILCCIAWVLKTSRDRSILMLLFGLRILIIVPMVFRVHYLFQNKSSEDPTLDRTSTTIASVFLLHATIIATCLPFMKPVMEHLQSGWTVGAVRPMEGSTSESMGTGWSAIRYPKMSSSSKGTSR